MSKNTKHQYSFADPNQSQQHNAAMHHQFAQIGGPPSVPAVPTSTNGHSPQIHSQPQDNNANSNANANANFSNNANGNQFHNRPPYPVAPMFPHYVMQPYAFPNHPMASHLHAGFFQPISPNLPHMAHGATMRSYQPKPIIIVHDNDVLSGRGVNIAQHPGNQRFRTLITTFQDKDYCTAFSSGEKRASAMKIIEQIKALDPPGRFLKRDGGGQLSRGLAGPWQELSDRDAVKKTCQALRDCNRQDRQGYAKGITTPDDILEFVEQANQIPARERAVAAAEAVAGDASSRVFESVDATSDKSNKRPREEDLSPEASNQKNISIDKNSNGFNMIAPAPTPSSNYVAQAQQQGVGPQVAGYPYHPTLPYHNPYTPQFHMNIPYPGNIAYGSSSTSNGPSYYPSNSAVDHNMFPMGAVQGQVQMPYHQQPQSQQIPQAQSSMDQQISPSHIIKKQRTEEDTEPSTGPSEPSPINGHDGNTPTSVQGRSGQQQKVNNPDQVSTWGNGYYNPTASIENDQFHDAMGGY